VRATTLTVERLEQRYTRLPDDAAGRARFDYWSPDLRCALVYDAAGLVLDYPGIAIRVRLSRVAQRRTWRANRGPSSAAGPGGAGT